MKLSYPFHAHTKVDTHTTRGVSLIDVVVGIGLFTLVVFSLIGAFRLGIEVIVENKARTGAQALAGEQIELARSLAYEDVGTVGGSPEGVLSAQENITLNTIAYTRDTAVNFYDDPKDGTGGSDADGNTNDYKKVKVELSWTMRGTEKSLFVATNIAP